MVRAPHGGGVSPFGLISKSAGDRLGFSQGLREQDWQRRHLSKANRADPGASKLRGVDEEGKHEKNTVNDDHDSFGDCRCVADDIGVFGPS